MQIPQVESPECRKFDETIVGYLVDGKAHCSKCTTEKNVPVYGCNVRPYSFACVKCGELVVDGAKKADGTGPLCLFND